MELELTEFKTESGDFEIQFSKLDFEYLSKYKNMDL